MAIRRPPMASCSNKALGTSQTDPPSTMAFGKRIGRVVPQHDGVKRAVTGRALGAIGAAHLGVGDARLGQVALGQLGQIGMHLQAEHLPRAQGEQGTQVATAGADLQHRFLAGQRQIVGQTGIDSGGQHGLPMGQGDFGVGISHLLAIGRHEIFALDEHQGVQNSFVQHLPGADLLFHHVEAGLVLVHRAVCAGMK